MNKIKNTENLEESNGQNGCSSLRWEGRKEIWCCEVTWLVAGWEVDVKIWRQSRKLETKWEAGERVKTWRRSAKLETEHEIGDSAKSETVWNWRQCKIRDSTKLETVQNWKHSVKLKTVRNWRQCEIGDSAKSETSRNWRQCEISIHTRQARLLRHKEHRKPI